MLEFSSKENYVLLVHYFLIAIVGPINLKRGEIMVTGWVFLKGGRMGGLTLFVTKLIKIIILIFVFKLRFCHMFEHKFVFILYEKVISSNRGQWSV